MYQLNSDLEAQGTSVLISLIKGDKEKIEENLPRILHFPIKELLDSSTNDGNIDESSKQEIKGLLNKAIEV